jgi:hypothetical protein
MLISACSRSIAEEKAEPAEIRLEARRLGRGSGVEHEFAAGEAAVMPIFRCNRLVASGAGLLAMLLKEGIEIQRGVAQLEIAFKVTGIAR